MAFVEYGEMGCATVFSVPRCTARTTVETPQIASPRAGFLDRLLHRLVGDAPKAGVGEYLFDDLNTAELNRTSHQGLRA